MKLEINGQQEGVPHPSWYRVHTKCPRCGIQDVPWTLTRYGQSSSRKDDQTGSGLHVGGFGAGMHTNRYALTCRCGFEVSLEDEPITYTKTEAQAKENPELPQEHYDGSNTIDRYYNAQKDALRSMFTARRTGLLGRIGWAYSIEGLCEYLNSLPLPEGTPKVTRSSMTRWLASENLTRPSRPPATESK